jgi:fimbrial isopeptide formation D2 family protein/LPXTG-motif cell wall-anchored protein
MRVWKRVLSVVAAAVMAVTMTAASGTVAWADGTTHTITIQKPDGSKDDHTYSAYQIFAGKYDGSSKKLSNIQWGSGVDGSTLLDALKQDSTIGPKFTNATTADAVADILTSFSNNSSEIDAFAKVAGQHLTEVNVESTKTQDGKITISGLADGYYLIEDTSTKKLTSDTVSKFMVQVIGADVKVAAKSTTTTSEKKVKEKNDSTGQETGWQDAADYDIGDDVPFQLTGTVASDYDQYSTYYFAFHDKQSAGLDAPTNIKVKIGDKTLSTSDYEVVTASDTMPLDDGCTFEIRFKDLKEITDATITGDTVITVEYTAKLNTEAVIGYAGNPNTSHIEFSNNPNNAAQHGKTPDDKVIVFTYETIVNKVDQNDKPLAGAGFTLYKKLKDNPVDHPYSEVKSFTADDKTTTFEFEGLDAGDYKLSETTTPAGYNTIADIEFTITAEYDTKSDDPQFLSLMGKSSTDTTVNLGTQTATVDPTAGTITTDIVNKAGSLLPSTGGIGAKKVIAAGAVLFAAGVALMFIRKKIAGRN